MAASTIMDKRVGLAYWMDEVLYQSAQAEQNFNSNPVHALRTALRRCRSLADGLRIFDRDPAWKKMRRDAKELFSSLGALRDTQVMMEWIEKLFPEGDLTSRNISKFLVVREQESRKIAAGVLQNFDRRQWKNWMCKLPDRAGRIPLGSAVFAHLALERLHEAYALHLRASRNRTKVAFHDLRIAIKRFRYTTENFLPDLYQSWSGDLKEMQDTLGEIHDIDVLWQTAIRIKASPDLEARVEWRTRLIRERELRVDRYRTRMTGRDSLWKAWREGLPKEDECRSLGLERLRTWAAFLNPKMSHPTHVAQLSLQIYDGMPIYGVLRGPRPDSYRWVLHAAALMHDIGRSKTSRGHHKASARLVRKLVPPLGWTSSELRTAALVVRYHRGALPTGAQTVFGALSPAKQRLVQILGGILRLACACDSEQNNQITDLQVESLDPIITIRAKGYIGSTPFAEHIAAARHLLELAYRRPVFIVAAEQMAEGAKPLVHVQAA